MRVVAFEREVLVAEILERFHRWVQDHARERAAVAGQLLARLLQMVGVEMKIAERMDKLPGLQSGHLGNHHGEQGIRCDVEGDTEKKIRAPLVKLTAQLPVLHVKLKQRVTGREGHEGEFSRIPCANNQPPAVRVRSDLRHHRADLVERGTVRFPPVPPLRAIDASEVARFIRPLVPNRHPVFPQVGDIRFAFEKPEQFMNDRTQVQLFRRDQWKPIPQIEPFLRPENRIRPRTRAIGFRFSFLENETKEPLILLHVREA